MTGASATRWLPALALAAAFGVALFAGLGQPLLWSDEGETAVYAERVLAYGYPKARDQRNLVYDVGVPLSAGVREPSGAFVASPWLPYYVAAAGAALAARADDLHAKTRWLRLPFALAGALAVAVAAAALAALAGPGGRRPALVAALLAAALGSVSLILHAREVRYYALAALELAALAAVHVWFRALGRGRLLAYAASTGGLLLLLFHSFLPGFAAAASAIGLDAVAEAWESRRGDWKAPLGRAALALGPALLLAIPGLAFYRTLLIGRLASRAVPMSFAAHLHDLGQALEYWLRFEFLAPALVARGLRAALARGRPATPITRTCRFLWLLIAALTAFVSLLPWFYSRYLVVASPLVSALALLELAALADASSGRARRAALAAASLAWLMSAVARAPEIAGRIEEIRNPYVGPLDVAIAQIRERYRDPRDLLIATNYEASVLIFYLQSRVIGSAPGDTEGAGAREPDIVIPRRAWVGPRLDAVLAYLQRGRWESDVLPVPDLPVNQIAELHEDPALPLVAETRRRLRERSPLDADDGALRHRFRTATGEGPYGPLTLYYRPAPDPRGG